MIKTLEKGEKVTPSHSHRATPHTHKNEKPKPHPNLSSGCRQRGSDLTEPLEKGPRPPPPSKIMEPQSKAKQERESETGF